MNETLLSILQREGKLTPKPSVFPTFLRRYREHWEEYETQEIEITPEEYDKMLICEACDWNGVTAFVSQKRRDAEITWHHCKLIYLIRVGYVRKVAE